MTDHFLALATRLVESLDWGDWSTIDVSPGVRIRLSIDPDDVTINDYDCYGRVAPALPGERPSWADGSARKLHVGNETYWWLPYREGHKVYDSDTDRAVVLRLLEEGFHILTLKRLVRCPCCSTWNEDTATSLAGIDDVAPDFLATVVAEMLEQLTTSTKGTTP